MGSATICRSTPSENRRQAVSRCFPCIPFPVQKQKERRKGKPRRQRASTHIPASWSRSPCRLFCSCPVYSSFIFLPDSLSKPVSGTDRREFRFSAVLSDSESTVPARFLFRYQSGRQVSFATRQGSCSGRLPVLPA